MSGNVNLIIIEVCNIVTFMLSKKYFCTDRDAEVVNNKL